MKILDVEIHQVKPPYADAYPDGMAWEINIGSTGGYFWIVRGKNYQEALQNGIKSAQQLAWPEDLEDARKMKQALIWLEGMS